MFWQKIYRIFVSFKKNIRKILKISSTLIEPPTPSAAPPAPASSSFTRPQNGTAHSTASGPGSGVSVAHLNFLPVKTQSTLKSPLEGHNLNPIHKPEEFLQKTVDR